MIRLLAGPKVKSLKVHTDRELGRGQFSRVFVGTLQYHGQNPRTVAVKIFKASEFQDKDEEEYGNKNAKIAGIFIKKLRRHNIPMIDADVIEHGGLWYQISRSVTRGGKSTLSIPKVVRPNGKLNLNQAKQYLSLIARAASIGLYVPLDSIHAIGQGPRARLVFADFDSFRDYRKIPNEAATKAIEHFERSLSEKTSPRAMQDLANHMISQVSNKKVREQMEFLLHLKGINVGMEKRK